MVVLLKNLLEEVTFIATNPKNEAGLCKKYISESCINSGIVSQFGKHYQTPMKYKETVTLETVGSWL